MQRFVTTLTWSGLIPVGIFFFLLLLPYSMMDTMGISPAVLVIPKVILIIYCMLLLSFLGGIHWGFAMKNLEDGEHYRAVLTWSVMPCIYAWAILLITEPGNVLLLCIIGFAGIHIIERNWKPLSQLLPHWFLALRLRVTLVLCIFLFGIWHFGGYNLPMLFPG